MLQGYLCRLGRNFVCISTSRHTTTNFRELTFRNQIRITEPFRGRINLTMTRFNQHTTGKEVVEACAPAADGKTSA